MLLRATRVVVHLRCDHPAGYRGFFNKLKFRRLLYALSPHPEGGYRIEIDGPLSLFQSSTKYGLQLALLLPALDQAGVWTLDAELRYQYMIGYSPTRRAGDGSFRCIRLETDSKRITVRTRSGYYDEP